MVQTAHLAALSWLLNIVSCGGSHLHWELGIYISCFAEYLVSGFSVWLGQVVSRVKGVFRVVEQFVGVPGLQLTPLFLLNSVPDGQFVLPFVKGVDWSRFQLILFADLIVKVPLGRNLFKSVYTIDNLIFWIPHKIRGVHILLEGGDFLDAFIQTVECLSELLLAGLTNADAIVFKLSKVRSQKSVGPGLLVLPVNLLFWRLLIIHNFIEFFGVGIAFVMLKKIVILFFLVLDGSQVNFAVLSDDLQRLNFLVFSAIAAETVRRSLSQ